MLNQKDSFPLSNICSNQQQILQHVTLDWTYKSYFLYFPIIRGTSLSRPGHVSHPDSLSVCLRVTHREVPAILTFTLSIQVLKITEVMQVMQVVQVVQVV